MAKNQNNSLRALPRMPGFPRKFSSSLRFTDYRADETIVSERIVALDGTGDFDNIQAAIDDLPSGGGKVIIKPGTYIIPAPITIPNSNISIQGSGESSIIDCQKLTTNLSAFDTNSKNNIHISYLAFTNAGASMKYFIIINNSIDSSISNCKTSQDGGTYLSSFFMTGTVTNSRIEANQITGGSGGIHFIGTGGIITNNNISAITSGSSGALICSSTSSNFTITSNIVSSGVRGTYLFYLNDSMIANNTFQSHVRDGIELNACSRNTIMGNSSINNGTTATGYGIQLNAYSGTDSDNNIISSNLLTGNDGAIDDNGTNTQYGHNITS